ncbi:RVT 1 domain containing protein [Asbolus verrucosus]|uniref:Telomerase reverse transcriptase n=1 Tax=Asbolus verrucosus TaxID=1661398 RepID=A0A482VFI3_ASBVE|nr:RVT 1 domain containing protein [Asbolus verrucosus]
MRGNHTTLFDGWKSYVRRHGDRRMYGVKLDIKDAYGNVDVRFLIVLISALRSEFLSDFEAEFVIERVKNQFVTFRKRVYQWRHGLLQGDRLSACLCELYMSYLDKTLPEVKPNCFMDRTVDDYIFCSTEAHEVVNFMREVRVTHQINETKTRTNVACGSDEEIPYCGKLFNLATKEVKKLYVFGRQYNIRHKFKLWNFKRTISETDVKLFLKKAMKFAYNNNCFTKMELNTVFNSQRTVLENFFEGMIYAAYKFDAAVMAVRNVLGENTDFILDVLHETVQQYSISVRRKVECYKGDYYREVITQQHLKILAYKAFVLVFKRRNEIYKNIIKEIKSVCDLKLHFSSSFIDYKYFTRLPAAFKDVKVNRSISM